MQAVGFLTITSRNNKTMQVTCYYLKDVNGTILSPTSIVREHKTSFYGWLKYANCDTGTGQLQFCRRHHHRPFEINIIKKNDLWYHTDNTVEHAADTGPPTQYTVHRMSNATNFELWHQRLGHCRKSTLEIMHRHAIGVPEVRGNTFYKCASCLSSKITKKPFQRKDRASRVMYIAPAPDPDDIHLSKASPGQHFHMDFGFVCSQDYTKQDREGQTVTSIDNKNSYLLIINRATRYMWIYLSNSKQPHIDFVCNILTKFKSQHPHRTVCTDQGKLRTSQAFRNMLTEPDVHFSLELTGTDNSRQNGKAERPHRTLTNTICCLLHATDLGPEYWSYALTHAVYLCNRIYHSSIRMTPYQTFTETKPDLTELRIFGSQITAKVPGQRRSKLQDISAEGRYLGAAATKENVYFLDNHTGKVKLGTHTWFDEAHTTVPAMYAPLAAQALQRVGYDVHEHNIQNTTPTQPWELEQFSPTATGSQNPNGNAKGYYIYPDSDIHIAPGETRIVPTGVRFKNTPDHPAYIKSVLSTQNPQIQVHNGRLEPAQNKEISLIAHNHSNTPATIRTTNQIAYLTSHTNTTLPIRTYRNLNAPPPIQTSAQRSVSTRDGKAS